MRGWFAAAWMLLGATFMVIAAIGVVRMPDLFTRMQAAAKTGTAGAGCVLLGTALYFGEPQVAAEAVVVVVFLLLTAPVAGHLLARAAYMTRVPLAPDTVPDELRDRFGRGPSVPGGTPGGSEQEREAPPAPGSGG
jgi:multicomponent Na+:H+ antiporter subunit G